MERPGPPPVGARSVSIGGTTVWLLADRAAFVPSTRSLLVADVHVGKAATFRRLGVPVPGGTTRATLDRLSGLLAGTAAGSVYFLGDLLHGPAARDAGRLDELARWRDRHRDVRMTLITGNHDARSGRLPSSIGIDTVDDAVHHGDLRFAHEPADDDRCHTIAGHVHPAIRLGGRVDSLRLPCFWLRRSTSVLPAFGEFTGGWTIRRQPGDRVFVSDRETVHEVPDAGLPLPARRAPDQRTSPST